MNQSHSIGALAAALAKAQGEFRPIPKDKQAKVPLKSGGSYSYNYADLATILDTIRPTMAAHGLAILQPASADGVAVTIRTILAHSSGEWISDELTLHATDNKPQSIGAAYSYGRRYAIIGMLSLSPDEDVDGEVDGEKAPRFASAKPPAKPAAAPPPAAKPTAKKADPAVLAGLGQLLKTSSLTAHSFGAEASRVLGRPVTSAADITIEEFRRVEAAVRAAELPDSELGRRPVEVEDYEEGEAA